MATRKKFGDHLLEFLKTDEDFLSGQLSVELLRNFRKDDPASVKGPIDYILVKNTNSRYLLRATRVRQARSTRSKNSKVEWQPQWSNEQSSHRDQATSPPSPGRLSSPSLGPGKRSPKGTRNSGSGTSKRGSNEDAAGVLHGRITKRHRKWPRILPHTKEKGLMNSGNMCYRNSILSCLLHQPTFYHYLRTVDHTCAKSKTNCTLCALKYLMDEYWSPHYDEKGAISDPREARKALDAALLSDLTRDDPMWSDIRLGGQSDAFDFAQHLISKMRSKEGPDSKFFIGDLFDLDLQRQWQCVDCGEFTEADSTSPFAAGLSIRIDSPKRYLPLQRYIEHFFEDKVSRRCDSAACRERYQYDDMGRDLSGKRGPFGGSPHPGFEREVLEAMTTVPELLLIKLDRAYALHKDHDTGRTLTKSIQYKMAEDVPLKERLDLTKYRADGSEEKLIYRLDGVCAHAGKLNQGHYIAVVREWNQQHDGKTFWTINDNVSVTQSQSFSAMQRPSVGGQKFSPFALLYSRVHPGERGYEDYGSLRAGEEEIAKPETFESGEKGKGRKDKEKSPGIMDDLRNYDMDNLFATDSRGGRRRRGGKAQDVFLY